MKHVLITGASGALGSGLIPLFAADGDTRVSLVLRADSEEHLSQRRRQLIEFCQLGDEQAERIDAVTGDISQEALGLRNQDAKSLARGVTHVVHAAGNVKLNQSIEDARRTALGSAKAVVDFVRRCQASGQFQKLEFVSTVGVAGRTSGLLAESRVGEPRQPEDFHNTYEAAKWESERYLWREIDAGLPATVHRPSMIVGDSRTGKIIHFQVFYFLTDFLLGRRTWGIVPRTDNAILDIIPVDYVAKAIHLSTKENLGVGQVWHLCSGPEVSWKLSDLVARLRELLAERDEPCPASRSISLSNFRRLLRIATRFAPARSRRFLSGLPFLLDYLGEEQAFDNTRTDRLLSQHGLTVPSVESYLETIMAPYWSRSLHSKRSG